MSTAVIIVNFFGYDDLDRCLESLVPQLRTNDEVIVVDNECDAEQLGPLIDKYPHILAIPSPRNLGFSAGVNLAVRHARAPFLLLLNPDTIIDGPVVDVLERWLLSDPHTAVVGPRVRNRDGTIQPSARRFPGLSTLFGGRSTWLTKRYPTNRWSRHNLLGLESDQPLQVDWISGSCLMTRREVFDRVGGLDEAFFLYWEDADYCRRVVDDGGRCTYLPLVSVRHLGGGSARYLLPSAIRAFHDSAYRLYWKHSGRAGRLAAPLVRAGLRLRGEMRMRGALRERRQIVAAPAPGAVTADRLPSAAQLRAPAEVPYRESEPDLPARAIRDRRSMVNDSLSAGSPSGAGGRARRQD